MAAVHALAPAAQPIALSAQYLRWGAGCFPSDRLLDKGARGLYSLGTIVVAPVGIFYHLSMAAYGALARLTKSDVDEKRALSTWAWHHFHGTADDALALSSALLVPLLITSLVMFSHFVACKELLLAAVSLLTIVFYVIMLNVALLYRYTVDPEFYRVFDASQRVGGERSLWSSCIIISDGLLILLQLLRILLRMSNG